MWRSATLAHSRAGCSRAPGRPLKDLYDELYDADDRAEIERPKTRLLTDLKVHRLAQGQEQPRFAAAGGGCGDGAKCRPRLADRAGRDN
jgi:hypothetical protein